MLKNNTRLFILAACFVGLVVWGIVYLRHAKVEGDYPRPLYLASAAHTASLPTPETANVSVEEVEVRRAIRQAISERSEMVLAYLLYDIQVQDVRISEDRGYASAWLVMSELEGGELLPTEPGIAFALQERGSWRAVMPGDADWLETLQDAPEAVLSAAAKEEWLLKMEDLAVELPSSALGGYLLPWAAGKVVSLSQSVSHDRYTPSGSAHYAFDFYISKTMWNIHAAKAGTVWMWKDDVPNDDNSGAGNYIVLQDTTTTPVTYQLYLHLAQYSIPPELKVKGTPVMQGQLIGIADNTGQSTGHHLHFQVHTSAISYWGVSVDITFNDVLINGGRPRRIDSYINELPYCWPTDICVQGQQSYISANTVQGDTTPPVGDIISVTTGQSVSTSQLLLTAWAQDMGTGLKSIQLIAKYDGAWWNIGPEYSASPVVYEWDLCGDVVPDGPVSLALRLIDQQGNLNPLAGLKHFTKAYACPPAPPACVPGPDQVALFSEPNFEGQCAVFNPGDYATTGVFPDNQAAALRVGANTWVTLFASSNFRDRSETFLADDSNLADNRVGLNTTSSLWVRARSTLPSTPLLLSPSAGYLLPANATASLFWEDTAGAQQFQVRLSGPLEMTSDWQAEPYLNIGGLPAGSYTWQVKARNAAGESAWSSLRTLSLQSGSFLEWSVLDLPYQYDVTDLPSGWTSTGLWTRLESDSGALTGEFFWRYGEGEGLEASYGSSGDLTSPPISIPALEAGAIERPYLRFWSRYDTETQGRHWDQRWVQVSVEGEPFVNQFQLYDDPMNYWVQSPYIDLSPYAGKEIRLRFFFTALDSIANSYQGWYIDNIEIQMQTLPACSAPGPQSGGPAGALELVYGDSIQGEICPPGEVDYYRFSAATGDRVVVDVDSHSLGYDLDAVLYLLDDDGSSQLAFHDDELLGTLFDPHLGYRIPRDGAYYLKLIAWDHPGAGSSQYAYDLSLFTDSLPPLAEISNPASGAHLPFQVTVEASVFDDGSGVSRVDFYWHSDDWLNSDWEKIGSDWSAQDGWKISFTVPDEQDGAAFYIRAYDWAGNWTGAGAWDLVIDRSPLFLPFIYR